jgi:hypothetical protein
MTTTELGELETLLWRVLPDPRGFAERALQQLMQRLATDPIAMAPAVVDSYSAAAHEALVDRNVLLASAVGACECWGDDIDCRTCAGAGSAGWMDPDAELFGELIAPALERMSQRANGHCEQKEGDNNEHVMAGGV